MKTTIILAAALAWVGIASAQVPLCVRALVNDRGTAGADVSVSTTAVVVARQNTSRCSLVISNTTANAMRCRPTPSGDPTTTAGVLLGANESLSMGTEGQQEWKCIRSEGSDAAANVIEGLPGN